MPSLTEEPGVFVVVIDQCMYGQITNDGAGGTAPAKKPTKFVTSSAKVADELRTRCDGSHVHVGRMGGRASEATARFELAVGSSRTSRVAAAHGEPSSRGTSARSVQSRQP